jgi:hypothetical protein
VAGQMLHDKWCQLTGWRNFLQQVGGISSNGLKLNFVLVPQPDWLSLFHMIVCDGQWIHINIWFAFLPHFLGMFLFPNLI